MELIKSDDLKTKILTIRGIQVMLDRDLAALYGVQTKVLNQAVKRNKERFPETFTFVLTKFETMELVTNCDRFNNLKHTTSPPHAFTEQGVAMLSTVIRSETAIKVSVQIMETFVERSMYSIIRICVFCLHLIKTFSMLTKKSVLETVQSLPDNFSLEEIIDRLILIQKIEIGLQQVNDNQVVSHEEAKIRMKKWLE